MKSSLPRYSLLIFLFLILFCSVKTLFGQPPSGLKWYSIKTPHYRVVFHEGLEDKALETAAIMDHVWDIVPDVYPIRSPQISLYLNSLTATSNAYMALGPRHMHFFLHPPQNVNMLGNDDWTRLLAVHEFRHTVQFDYLDRNLFSAFSGLFGDIGRGTAAFLLIPAWYYEGDAISAETSLTSFGRGRMAEFEMPMKAILTGTDQKFSYNQAYLLSYKRFFPDHYYLGYFMHTHVARNYGSETWPSVIDRVTRGKSFSPSLKKLTGFPSRKIYRNTMDELKEIWAGDHTPIPDFLAPLPSAGKADYTSYRYGHRMADGTVVAVRYGPGYSPMIIRTNEDGQEKRLRGLNSDLRISANGSQIVWSTSTPHTRWDMQDQSDILMMDATSGKVRKITSDQKYMSPALAPNGKWIAAVNYHDNLAYSLDIIDAETAEILYSIPSVNGQVPRTPSWSTDGRFVVYTANGVTTSALCLLNHESRTVQTIPVDPQENVSSPVASDQYLYFISSATGNSELHAIHRASGRRFIALKGGYGYFNPVLDHETGEMIIESYTPYGYKLFSWQPDPALFIPYLQPEPIARYIDPVLAREEKTDIFADFIPDTSPYTIQRFHHFPQGMKLHSWYFLPDLQGVSATAIASDPLLLHNFSGTLGYNQNEQTTYQSIDYTYTGLYPVLSLGVLNGRRNLYSTSDSVFYGWNEQSLKLGADVPLNLSREDHEQTFTLSAGGNYTFLNGLDNRYKKDYDRGNGSFSWLQAGFSWRGNRTMALRDFYPSLGMQLDVSYRGTVQSSDYIGSLTSLAATAFLPGIFRHHSLRVQGTWEEQNPDFNPNRGYIFQSEVLYFRGYDPVFHLNTAKLSVDYAFPLLYPDVGIGGFIYCKRIRANLFADHGYGKTLGFRDDFTSYGVDLLFDLNFFRFPAEIDLGIRLVTTTEQTWKPEFIFLQRF